MGEFYVKATENVFISYSSLNQKEIEWITELLFEMDIPYWKAPEMIPVGSNYAQEIPRAIKECGVFLVCVSKEAQNSIWIEKEIDSAINHRKHIIPVRLDATPLNDLFTFYLNNVQAIPYFENREQGRLQLRRRLQAIYQETDLHITNGLEGKKQSNNKEKRKRQLANALSMNPAPVECSDCGGELEQVSVGVYRCCDCGKEHYDYLRTVRNYLEKNGAKPAIVISNATGVPRESVDFFLRQEYLEIPKHAPERISCLKCGASIRSGMYCASCKSKEELEKKTDIWHFNRKY